MEDTLVKLLIVVEVGCAAAHAPPDDGQTRGAAGGEVDYSAQRLVITDAYVGFLRACQDDSIGGIFRHQCCQGVIQCLGANPGNLSQCQQSDSFVHQSFPSV